MMNILEKFLRYVAIDTEANPDSKSIPSADKQLRLSEMLVQELHEIGIRDASLDKYGYVMATIPSTVSKKTPIVGFIAHVDTSPDMSGANVKPNIVQAYDGKDIVLNKEKNSILKVKEFPEIANYKGQTIITTDGATLLGADDKAGIAIIMEAAEYLMQHPEIPHGEIKIGFTRDEEIGRGVDKFDVKKFGADYAYTFDGGGIGELEYENFNAAAATITIHGNNIHPGYAKDKMINAILAGMELQAMLPAKERPEYTQDYEGFFHLNNFYGTVENVTMKYIIRDHDKEKFEDKKAIMNRCVDAINERYGTIAKLEMEDQYYNMRSQIEAHFQVVEKAITAMKQAGVTPKIQPIRGGTDGARLSFMGLPCPNIFTGGHNFHGKYEYIPLQSMEKAVEVMINLVQLYV